MARKATNKANQAVEAAGEELSKKRADPVADELPLQPSELMIVDHDIPVILSGERQWAAEQPGRHVRVPDPKPPGDREGEVNPFPPIIRTAVLKDGYTIRLQQSQSTNEVQIKFGEGRPADKPSAAIIAFIKAQEGPHGTRFRWSDADRAWGMPIRDPIHDPRLLATREKARRIFNDVVKMAAQERGTGIER
jgi:hypothetical protein